MNQRLAALRKENRTTLRVWQQSIHCSTLNGNIIVAALSFQGNPHYSKTLDKTLQQQESAEHKSSDLVQAITIPLIKNKK